MNYQIFRVPEKGASKRPIISLIQSISFLSLLLFSTVGCKPQSSEEQAATTSSGDSTVLSILQDEQANTISIFRAGESTPIVTQNVKPDFRPYLHPIAAPDGKGELTEYSPGHHKHQTGLYWGFTRVNGRDYFHHPEGDYWRKVSANVIESEGKVVRWQTVYDLLDEQGKVVLTETQNWSMRETGGRYLLDLEWSGEGKTDVTIGEYDYGGLFLRMPWVEGIKGEVVNAARQKNENAEGQRAMWVDAGMQVAGRDDLAHVAILDHKDNKGFPQTWRVDGQLGIGPVRARMGDWTIAKGQTETIKHEIVVYTGALNDIEMTETWQDYVGDHDMYSTAVLWGIAQEEARNAKFLKPEEAVEAMTIKDGFDVNVWAAEPMMSQPMAFCWDDKGRLWIAENKDYESRGYGFSKAGDSRILILEDTDHDGVADSRKVFLEGIAFPSAIAVGFDGVFIGAPPNLLFVPDKNHDDKADMDDIEIRLSGWGIRDRHETLNSFHWGPDGWLYGLQGFATPSKVKLAKGKGRIYKHNDPFPEDIFEGEGTDINGGVWRYHPTKDKFEVVAHGFSNPWGIDFDAKGQLLMSACVIPHLWHVIPGGIYHRQGGQHFNPYVYNDIKTIADHRHRSAHGGLRVYLSDAFPAEQQGRLFMANIHEHAVLSDVLEPKGSGFIGHHGEEFLMANNAQWVGFSMELGPEGALYVLDWHDADICGKEVLNEETGRIFRIAPKQSLAENWEGRYGDLSKLTDVQLVALQTSKSSWHARRARLILQGRAAKAPLAREVYDQLRVIFASSSTSDFRMNAMWGLHVTGGFNEGQLIESLSDKDEYVRAWAVQLLSEEKASDAAVKKFTAMAQNDKSAVVRLYLASAMQRLLPAQKWAIAEALMSHSEDIDDHNLPKMLWFGTEPLVAENPERALQMASESKIPMLAEYIARRAVDADAIEPLIAAISKKPTTLGSLLEGMRNGLEGRTDLTTPPGWKSVYAGLQKSSDKQIQQLALEVAQLFGDTEAAMQYLTTLKDKSKPVDQRRKALNSLADQQRKELIAEFSSLMGDPALRIDAIRAVAAFDENSLGQMLIEKYKTFNSSEKLEAIQALSSRPDYGWALTQALKNEVIPKPDVPAYVARQLRRVVGSGFVEVWGPIDELGSDIAADYKKYAALLTNQAVASADIVNGQSIFQRTCGACHKMYAAGGGIGPELTGSNRANLDYLLSNVLDPSGEIQDDYKMVVVTTRDGRTYSGNINAENERQLTIRVVGQDAVVINKSDIQSREESANSMMPPGLFYTLSDKEIIDLVGYLKTSGPVDQPTE